MTTTIPDRKPTPMTTLRLDRFDQSRPPHVAMSPWPADHPRRGRPDLAPAIDEWVRSDRPTLLVSAPGWMQAATTVHDVVRPHAANGVHALSLTLQQLAAAAEYEQSGLLHVAEQVSMLVLYDVDPHRATHEDDLLFGRVMLERLRYANCRQVVVTTATAGEIVTCFGDAGALLFDGCDLVKDGTR